MAALGWTDRSKAANLCVYGFPGVVRIFLEKQIMPCLLADDMRCCPHSNVCVLLIASNDCFEPYFFQANMVKHIHIILYQYVSFKNSCVQLCCKMK